jgi:hypothetical protein
MTLGVRGCRLKVSVRVEWVVIVREPKVLHGPQCHRVSASCIIHH